MHEDLKFEFEDGKNSVHNVTVYALSTCGFCKRALKFLRDNSIAFRYIYVDYLDPEVKSQLKADLKEKYNRRVTYPFLILDADTEAEKVFTGFVNDVWTDLFGLPAQ
ncbi:MAG: glutaredoxin family protein [Promethearchaeota archaeon]